MTTTTRHTAAEQTGASALAPQSLSIAGYDVALVGDIAGDAEALQAAEDALCANAELFGKFEPEGTDWLIDGPFTIWSQDGRLSIEVRPEFSR